MRPRPRMTRSASKVTNENLVSIDQALLDQALLGAALGNIATWAMWVIVLKAAFGLPLDEAERATFTLLFCTRKPAL
jgi:hypothetical protein